MSADKTTLVNLLQETRRFPPPEQLAASANVTADVYDKAAADRLGFWEEMAHRLDWATPWQQVLDWSNPPFAKWFVGGTLNVSENCVDRHVAAGRGDKVAFYWEGEPGDTRTITYADLHRDVQKFANVLKGLGVAKGDRVAIYMPMIPELPIAMLACARLGAPHSVIFGGFSPDSIIDRVNDAECSVVITADAGYRRGAPSMLKPNVDLALASTPSVRHVVVVNRCDTEVHMEPGRDHWWQELMADADEVCPADPAEDEHHADLPPTTG